MTKILMNGVAFLMLGFGPAVAADMPVKAAPPAVAVAAWDWSGFYAGLQVGWIRTSSTIEFLTAPGVFIGPAATDATAVGVVFGVQRQFGQFVVGIEWNGITEAPRKFGAVACPAGPPCQSQVALHNAATIGGRLGWATGSPNFNVMPYVAGGYATGLWEERGVNAPPGTIIDRGTAWFNGVYYGGGLDWMVTPNLIVGAEYRHYDFRSGTILMFTPAGVRVAGDDLNLKPKADTVMVRATGKFWPWPK